MQSNRTPALLLIAALLACGCTSLADRDQAAVRQLVDRFVRSVNEANTENFVQCFAPDATAFFPSPANAMRRTGRDAIRVAVAPAFAAGSPAARVEPRDLTIDVEGDAALVTFDAGSGTRHARRTLVLRRSQGQWLITHLHASNVDEAR